MWANAQRDGRLPNICGALCSTPQSWLTPTTTVPCSKAAKTQNSLKFAGVPQTNKPISVVGGPKFAILSEHVEKVLLFNNFVRLSIYALVAKIQPDKVVRWCRDGDFWLSFASCIFSEPRAAVSDLHSKFGLRSHHVWKYGRHPICDG